MIKHQLFEYELDPEHKNCCIVKTQPILKAIRDYKTIDFKGYSIIGSMDMKRQDVRLLIKQLFTQKFINKNEDRAIGALTGLVVGDAFGASIEFTPLKYNSITITDIKDTPRARLKAGMWTDDSSQALCLADSLLVNKSFSPIDTMLRYIAWWYFGMNNAHMFEDETNDHESVGLGGNTRLAFDRFMKHGESFTKAGDKNTSGNGSLMRLSPVAIAYHRNINKGLQVARLSSFVTHQGIEASECSALLAYILICGINTGDKSILNEIHKYFKSSSYSVNCLAASMCETKNGKPDVNRNWNWKDSEFKYSPERAAKQPEYIGSYAMDALSMALHCFWTTDDFKSCILKTCNLGGDADSVGAIAGQIAGAFYGVSNIPSQWVNLIMKWDGGGTIAYRAYKLYKKNM